MKILLVGNYLDDRQESMQRFTALMAEGLTQAGHEVKLVRPPVFMSRFGLGFRGLRKWLGYVDKFVLFPRLLRDAALWADVVHICDHSNAMYARYLQSRAHVVTCHDMLAIRSARGEFPGNRPRWSGRVLQRMILDGLKRTRHLVCVSESTRADLIRLSSLSADHISVVQNGQNYPYSPMPRQDAVVHLRKLGIVGENPFLLHVGGNQWYKNRLGVLRIFVSLLKRNPICDLTLVMAGKPWTQEMCQFVRDNELERRITHLAGVSSEELRALYSSASALLFPSLQEGFGWPVIEAQACGCTVFTSDRAPMNDVGGSAAIYLDPEDVGGAARIIEKEFNSARDLSMASIENAARFSTSAMIRDYLKIYESILQ